MQREYLSTYLLIIIPGLPLSEFNIERVLLFSICANPSFDSVIKYHFYFVK